MKSKVGQDAVSEYSGLRNPICDFRIVIAEHKKFSHRDILLFCFQARLSRRQHRHCSKREGTRACALTLKVLKVLRPFFQVLRPGLNTSSL